MEGESITIAAHTEFVDLRITCSKVITRDIFGLTDEVKVFQIQVFERGEPVISDFDDFEFILSENGNTESII